MEGHQDERHQAEKRSASTDRGAGYFEGREQFAYVENQPLSRVQRPRSKCKCITPFTIEISPLITRQINEFVLKTCTLGDRNFYRNELTSYRILLKQEGVRPNIVHLYADFEHRNKLHLVLEHVNGGTLEDLYQSEPPSTTHIPAFWSRFLAVFTPLYQMHELKHLGDHLKA